MRIALNIILAASLGLNVFLILRGPDPVQRVPQPAMASAAVSPITCAPASQPPVARPRRSASGRGRAGRSGRARAVALPSDAPEAETIDAWRHGLPVEMVLHEVAIDALITQLKPTFTGPIKPTTAKARAVSLNLHMRDATAAMTLNETEASAYEAWFSEQTERVDAAYQSGDRVRHLDALIEGFIAEDRYLEGLVGVPRARAYVNARLEHRVWVLAGIAAAADVDPYVAIARYQGTVD